MGSISGWGRSPREGNGIPQQYFCLGNPMDRGNWWATIPGVAKNQTTKQQQKQWLMMLNIPSNAYLYIFSVKCLFMSFAHFLIRAFILSLLSLGFLCILQILVFCWVCGLQIFSLSLQTVFSFCLWFPFLCKHCSILIKVNNQDKSTCPEQELG